MATQASVNSESNGTSSVNESPPQAVARSSLEFLHDLITLGELQLRLVEIDAKNGFSKLFFWLGILVAGICLALACLPLCLAAIALVIAEQGHFSLSQAFGIAVTAGLVTAGGILATAIVKLKNVENIFDRSWAEWRQNVRWAKNTMRKLSTPSSKSTYSDSKNY